VPLGIPLQAFLYSHSYLLNVTIQFANKTGVLKEIMNRILNGYTMDQNYIINEQQQMIQQQLVQQQQQQLVQQPQQQCSVSLQYYPIQQTGYGIIPAQHNCYSVPSFTNVQPSQQTPGLINIPTRNNIGKRQSEREQEIENETTSNYTWQTIKKRKRNNPTPENRTQQTEIICYNRYEQLSQSPDNNNDDIILTDRTNNTQINKEFSTPRDPKPPPIFVYGVTNYKDMIAHLSTIIEEEQQHCKVISNATNKIHVATPESYRKLIKQLQEDKIIHHTYQMKQERAYRIVIRNIHYSTPTAQITAELEKQGHKVRNMLNVKHRVTKEPLSLFFVDLEPKENNKDIYDM
jgi:hypothetical protein